MDDFPTDYIGRLGVSTRDNEVLYYDLINNPGYCYKYIKKRQKDDIKSMVCLGCRSSYDKSRKNGEIVDKKIIAIKAKDLYFVSDPEQEKHFCEPYPVIKSEAEQVIRSVANKFKNNNVSKADFIKEIHRTIREKHPDKSTEIENEIPKKRHLLRNIISKTTYNDIPGTSTEASISSIVKNINFEVYEENHCIYRNSDYALVLPKKRMTNMSTETALRRLLDASQNEQILTIENFINDQFVSSNDTIYSVDPSTGKNWLKIPRSTKDDVEIAVKSAKNAFKEWSKTSVQTRSKLLNKVADILEPLSAKLAELESKDQGKTVKTASIVDIPRCIHNFRTFASAILHHTGTSSIQKEPINAINYVQHDPIGVAALISPWNLPLYLLSFKLAPALACGNTVVAKPSEMTSATAYILMHAFKEAGFPSGVVNLVIGTGKECGEYLVTHPDVDLVSFTGSTMVGKRISELAAATNKKVSLEMGGKNAGIIFDDVNIDEIMPSIVNSCFANQGEICLCTERLYVHSNIYDEFLNKFVQNAKTWITGDPEDSLSNIGALVSEQHFQKVKSYHQLAESEGATIHCGGPVKLSGRCSDGYFFAPTIITNVQETSRLMFDEVFGPFVVVSKFNTKEEVIEKANSTKYGLSASVFSKNIDNVTKVASELRVGTVWCNCWMVRELNMPFGGTKESGNGRDGTLDSFDFYSEKKTICIKMGS